MKTATKQQFLHALAQHPGATWELQGVDQGPDSKQIELCAPDGHRWAGSCLHYIVAWKGYGGTVPMGELYAFLIDDMDMGLEECPGCDVCTP